MLRNWFLRYAVHVHDNGGTWIEWPSRSFPYCKPFQVQFSHMRSARVSKSRTSRTRMADFTHQSASHISKTNFVTCLVFEICSLHIVVNVQDMSQRPILLLFLRCTQGPTHLKTILHVLLIIITSRHSLAWERVSAKEFDSVAWANVDVSLRVCVADASLSLYKGNIARFAEPIEHIYISLHNVELTVVYSVYAVSIL